MTSNFITNKYPINKSTPITNKNPISKSTGAYPEPPECITIFSTAFTVARVTPMLSTAFTALIVIVYGRLDHVCVQ